MPRLGEPGSLTDGEKIEITVATEKEHDGKHGVWFNRGVVASHKMSQQFKNQKLTKDMTDDVDASGKLRNAEVAWLSRGLAEACLAYINSARSGDGLRVCAYEFTWAPVLQALKRAHDRGVDVEIIYHGVEANRKVVRDAGLPASVLSERTRTKIPHNKFIVKLSAGQAREVWTGSTNFTDTGFFGQTNVGHLVTDQGVANAYLKLWEDLKDDPTHSIALKNATKLTPNPPNVIPANSIVEFYSPRIFDNMLYWYAQRIKDACSLTLMTIPFDVSPTILTGLADAKCSLRLVILEDEPSREVRDAEIRNRGMLAFSNGAILGKTFVHVKGGFGGAKSAPIPQSKLDQWFLDEELARPLNNGHVFFVHSKVLLIDPLSEDPLVCSGSANFSKGSLIANDENMLLIRGDTRVADIYLTEIDRIFRHFYERDAINRNAEQGRAPIGLHLDKTSAWIDANFRPGSYKLNRLNTFFPDVTAPSLAWSKNAARDADPFADEAERAANERSGKNERAKTRRAAGGTVRKSGAKKRPVKKTSGKKQPKKKAAAKRPAKKAARKQTLKKSTRKTAAKRKIVGKALGRPSKRRSPKKSAAKKTRGSRKTPLAPRPAKKTRKR